MFLILMKKTYLVRRVKRRKRRKRRKRKLKLRDILSLLQSKNNRIAFNHRVVFRKLPPKVQNQIFKLHKAPQLTQV